jgi:hypothetical protein
MKKVNQRYVFVVLVAAILGFIIWNSLSQPGTKDLKGNFKQVAFYRNEQNTGPVVRVYAVTLSDTIWDEMKSYGDYMPYTKYGNTKVYFFLDSRPFPTKIGEDESVLEAEFRENCLAKYEKDAMGQVYLIKKPFLR